MVNPKSLWINNGCIGINWVLVQAKIFQPIIKLEQCLIIDEFEESPLKHYHHKLDNDSESRSLIQVRIIIKNLKKNMPSLLKKKDLGVQNKQLKLNLKNIQNYLVNLKIILGIKDEKIPEYKPKPKITINLNLIKSRFGCTTSALRPPTANELQNVLKDLNLFKRNYIKPL